LALVSYRQITIFKHMDKQKIETQQIDTNYNTPKSLKQSLNYKLLGVISIFLVITALLMGGYFLFFKAKPAIVTPKDSSSFPVVNSSNTNNTDYYEGEVGGGEEDNYEENEYGELFHLWPLAVSGYSTYKKMASSTTPPITSSIFTDKLTGNIYVSESPIFEAKKIVGESMINTLKSNFSYDHSYGTILSDKYSLYLIKMPSDSSSALSFIEKTLIDEGVIDISFSKNKNMLAYLKKESSGTSLNIYDIDKNANSLIYRSPLSDINIDWLNTNNILIKSKTSNLAQQTLIEINIETLKITLLNSSNVSNSLQSDYKNISFDGANIVFSQSINSLSKDKTNILSLPDKCVYMLASLLCAESLTTNIYSLPDEWYKGNVSFIDHLTLYNTNTKKYSRYDLSVVAGESIDFYKPITNLDNITFMNKRDMSLWLLNTDNILN
jgi:hypothetical protein